MPLFLEMRRRFNRQISQRQFWTWFSLITLLFIPAIIFVPSSTAVDRVALYFMPIQLLVFSYLPTFVRPWRLTSALVIIAFGAVMLVWFSYSPYVGSWLPYHFYPFEVQ